MDCNPTVIHLRGGCFAPVSVALPSVLVTREGDHMDIITAPRGATAVEKGSLMAVAVTPDDGGSSFEAQWIAPQRVNGFLVPYFTRDEAERVVAWMMDEPFPGEVVEWDEESVDFRLTIEGTKYEYHYPHVWRDGTKLFGIGAEELSWLPNPPTLAPSELHEEEWAEATARASQWITLQSLFDWRELAAGVDPELVLARQGFYDRFPFPDSHEFWGELAEYLRNEIAAEVDRAQATHEGE